MLECKVMTSSSLSPVPISVLSSECYGIWEHETLHPIATEETDIMEFMDPSSTSALIHHHHSTSPLSSSSSSSTPSSPPASTTTTALLITAINDSNNRNSNNNSNSTMLSGGSFHSQHHLHHQNNHNQQQQSHHDTNDTSYSPSSYLTQLPSLNMMSSNDPYNTNEVQMLESFNCIGNSDAVFHKLSDGFADSYESFLEDQSTHQQISSELSPSQHHQNHQPGSQSLNNLHNHQQQHHDHSTHNGSNSNQLLGINSNSFQFSEPTLLPHQSHHHQSQQHHHHQLQHHSSFQSNHEYNIWDDPSNFLGDYRFICKVESPTTSDSVSYTSVDSGIDCSKSSSESVSTSTFNEIRHVSPPKRRVGRPPKKDKKLKRLGKEKKTGRLWEFIRDLLKNPEYCPSLVRWENPEEGHFRFVNSDQVAKLWGRLKGNPRMTYEKLSRAMRYYYKSHVFEPVLGRRLVYKFGFNATNWRPSNPNFSQKIFC